MADSWKITGYAPKPVIKDALVAHEDALEGFLIGDGRALQPRDALLIALPGAEHRHGCER